MANHKSAIKRARQSELRRLRNKISKTRVKTIVKKTQAEAQESPAKAVESLKIAMKVIDKAAAGGTLHRKTASRKIARLSRQVFKAQSGAAS